MARLSRIRVYFALGGLAWHAPVGGPFHPRESRASGWSFQFQARTEGDGASAATQPVAGFNLEDPGAVAEPLAVARSAARVDLKERIERQLIREGMSLGAWIDRAPRVRIAFDQWLDSLEILGPVRSYSTGAVEVDFRVSGPQLAAVMTRLASLGSPADYELDVERLNAALQPLAGFHVTGAWDAAEPPPVVVASAAAGWEGVLPEGVRLAREAAVADALLNLLTVAGRLRASPSKLVSDILAGSPGAPALVSQTLSSIARVEVSLSSERVAMADATLSIVDLTRVLCELHPKLDVGPLVSVAELRELPLNNPPDDLRATGRAMPPQRMLAASRPIPIAAPEWAGRIISARGVCAPSTEEIPPLQLRIDLALAAAFSTLRDQVLQLRLPSGGTLSAAWAERPILQQDVETFLTGVRWIGDYVEADDGTVEVRIELPLGRLWKVVETQEVARQP